MPFLLDFFLKQLVVYDIMWMVMSWCDIIADHSLSCSSSSSSSESLGGILPAVDSSSLSS